MTWLREKVAGDSSLDEVYGLSPKVHEHFRELERDVWGSGVDPALLELARLRIATLVGCYHGMLSGRGAMGVGQATKTAVSTASVLILAANFILTSVLFGS